MAFAAIMSTGVGPGTKMDCQSSSKKDGIVRETERSELGFGLSRDVANLEWNGTFRMTCKW